MKIYNILKIENNATPNLKIKNGSQPKGIKNMSKAKKK